MFSYECWAYLSILIAIGDPQVGHGAQDGDERLDRVAVHHRPVLFEVFICKATFVDNSVKRNIIFRYLSRIEEKVYNRYACYLSVCKIKRFNNISIS